MLRASSAAPDKVEQLLYMVRCNPEVRSCIMRTCNACMGHDFQISEKGASIKTSLREVLDSAYQSFLRDSVEIVYTCGFVPYYVRIVEQVAVPFVVPLGMFTWAVESCDPARDGAICRYTVKIHSSSLKESDVHIVNFAPPMLNMTGGRQILSPMDAIVECFCILQQMQTTMHKTYTWNSEKHIVITETVNLSDQTTSGIQLLDDVRRYTLSGEHALMGHSGVLRMKNRHNKELKNTNEAKLEWVHEEFAGSQYTKGAVVHVLPPNMQAVELSIIQSNGEFDVASRHFIEAVYAFFHLTRLPSVSSERVDKQVHQDFDQYLHLQTMHKFLCVLAQSAYARCFKVERSTVKFDLIGAQCLRVTSVEDLKTLCEWNIFDDKDRRKFQKIYNAGDG